MKSPEHALARARSAPAAWAALAERVRGLPADEAWPLLRDALAVPRTKVEPEALALLSDAFRRADPDEFLPLVLADARRGPPPVRRAGVEAVEAAAGRTDPARLLDALEPFLADGDERVRERAASALGVLALHAPEVAGPRIALLALGADDRRAQAAVSSLWGLAASDLTAALAVVEALTDAERTTLTRRALVQVGFAYRWRPLAPEERAALWASLTRVARSTKGPGRKAVVEAALPLAAFNEREDALADLDAFLAALGTSRPQPSPARPPPRPHVACAECGEGMDFAAYFCPACLDVKAHNPLRALEGLPVARSPPWPRGK